MSAGPFDLFIAVAHSKFSFLVEEFGFQLARTDRAGAEARLTFDSPHARITVTYELGSHPWLTVAALEQRGGKLVAARAVPLTRLTGGRGLVLTSARMRDLREDELDSLLSRDAEDLRTYGGDILAGDVSRLKRR